MLVVMAHATQMVHERMGTGQVLHFGASGVDIFFPISGFVMAVTTYKRWGQAGVAADFLLRRLIRIVPLYWAATLLKLAAVLALPALTSHPNPEAWHVVASFLFIPEWDPDGKALPLLPVGWTLNYEMLFYALFAVVLAFRLRPVLWLGAILLCLSFLPYPRTDSAIATLANPILMEFVAGMFIGWATVAGHRMPARLAVVCLAASFGALAMSQALPESFGIRHRHWLWGVPGSVALVSVIALEPLFKRWRSRWAVQLGDASYAIYLIHGFVVPFVGVAFLKLQASGAGAGLGATVVACVLSAIVGVVVHQRIEGPLTHWLNSRLLARRAENLSTP